MNTDTRRSASTALEFVRALRLATDIAHVTTIVAIYQAGESFGPAEHARQYFIDMGYEPANRQTTADFLVAVTDPHGRTLRKGFEDRAPRTADEFAQYFLSSDLGAANRQDMEHYRMECEGNPEKSETYRQSNRAEHATTSRARSSYIISIPMQARALMLRRVQIIKGAVGAQVIQVMSFVLQAVIVGTIFLRVSDTTSTFFSQGGVMFLYVMPIFSHTSRSLSAQCAAFFRFVDDGGDPGALRSTAHCAPAYESCDVPPVRRGRSPNVG